ncbi:MAG: hypothetical protein AAGG50_04270 [Bacteroidota bacterium]
MDSASLEVVLNLASGMGGAVLGASVAYVLARNRGRRLLTFELHREFHSDRILRARSNAEKFVRKYPNTIYNDLNYTEDEDILRNSTWELIGFYERLWLSVKHKRVDRDLIPELFGNLFYWWYIVAFEKLLVPSKWSASDQISDLKKWFDENTYDYQKEEWSERGRVYRDEIESLV